MPITKEELEEWKLHPVTQKLFRRWLEELEAWEQKSCRGNSLEETYQLAVERDSVIATFQTVLNPEIREEGTA